MLPLARSGGLLALAILSHAATDLAGQGAWTRLSPASEPTARGGHGGCGDGGGLLMFGGNIGNNNTLVDELWRFDGAAWTNLTPAAGSPPGRDWHGQAFDIARNRLVIFGGRANGGGRLGDTWEWDGANWAQINTPNAPSPRQQCAMTYDLLRGKVVLFGGDDGSRQGDTWEYDGVNWTQVTTTTMPGARNRHGITYDFHRARCVMHGGFDSGGGYSPETWAYDGTDWTLLDNLNAPFGTGLFQFAITYDFDRRRVLLNGGSNASSRSKTWDFDGNVWIDRGNFLGQGLIARTGNAMAYVPALRKTFMFGGFTNAGFVSETYEWSTDAIAAFSTSGGGCAGGAGNPQLRSRDGGLPWAGDTFEIFYNPLAAGALPTLVIGISDTQWAGGALPFSFAILGRPQCNLLASPDAVIPGVTQNGVATFPIPIPEDPSLYGLNLFAQGIAFEGLTLVATNLGRLTIGAY